jgi:hypothetical protein
MVQYRLTWTLKPLTVMNNPNTTTHNRCSKEQLFGVWHSCLHDKMHIHWQCHWKGSIRGSCSLARAIPVHKQVGHITCTISMKFIITLNLGKCFRGQVLTSKLCRTTQPEKHEVGVHIDEYLGSSWTGRAPLSFGWWKGRIIVPYYSHWLNIYQCSRTRTSCAC